MPTSPLDTSSATTMPYDTRSVTAMIACEAAAHATPRLTCVLSRGRSPDDTTSLIPQRHGSVTALERTPGSGHARALRLRALRRRRALDVVLAPAARGPVGAPENRARDRPRLGRIS